MDKNNLEVRYIIEEDSGKEVFLLRTGEKDCVVEATATADDASLITLFEDSDTQSKEYFIQLLAEMDFKEVELDASMTEVVSKQAGRRLKEAVNKLQLSKDDEDYLFNTYNCAEFNPDPKIYPSRVYQLLTSYVDFNPSDKQYAVLLEMLKSLPPEKVLEEIPKISDLNLFINNTNFISRVILIIRARKNKLKPLVSFFNEASSSDFITAKFTSREVKLVESLAVERDLNMKEFLTLNKLGEYISKIIDYPSPLGEKVA